MGHRLTPTPLLFPIENTTFPGRLLEEAAALPPFTRKLHTPIILKPKNTKTPEKMIIMMMTEEISQLCYLLTQNARITSRIA
jgi:hypothetical protein